MDDDSPPPCPTCGGPRQWYRETKARCKPCLAAKARERYWKDPAADNAKSRAWHAANRERHAELNRAWQAAHPGYHETKNREFYAENRAAEIARSLAYTKAHPEVDAAIKSRRRARKMDALCDHGWRLRDGGVPRGCTSWYLSLLRRARAARRPLRTTGSRRSALRTQHRPCLPTLQQLQMGTRPH